MQGRSRTESVVVGGEPRRFFADLLTVLSGSPLVNGESSLEQTTKTSDVFSGVFQRERNDKDND